MKCMKVLSPLSGCLLLAGLVSAQCIPVAPPPPPHTVPDGGDPVYNGPVDLPVPAPVPPPPPPVSEPGATTGGTTRGLVPLGGTTRLGSGRKGGRARARVGRPKKFRNGWTDRVSVTWNAVFPPADARAGYDEVAAGLSQGISRSPAEGGWVRDDASSLVLVYDPSDRRHLKVIASLESDKRFRVATWVFNVFKVVGRQLPKDQQGLRLLVFDKDGVLVKGLAGKQVRQVMGSMEAAYLASTKRKLSDVMPHIERNVGGIAYCKEKIAWLESRIVCADCGKAHDVPESIAKFKKDMGQYVQALAGFRH